MTSRALRWCLTAGLLACTPAWAGVVDRVAAVVNDEVITWSEIYDLGGDYIEDKCTPVAGAGCVRETELEILDTLIKWALVRMELDRLQMRITGADVDRAIDQIVRDYQLEDRQALRAEVERSGTRWDAYREQLEDQLRSQRFRQEVIVRRLTISDDEVRDRYQRTARGEERLEVELDALGIPIPAGAEPELVAEMVAQADGLVAAINGGELDWVSAVEQYDGAGLSGAIGGRTYPQGQLTPEVDEVAFSAPLNVVQPPIRAGNLLFVIRVLSRQMGTGDVQAFEAVEEDIRNQIFEEKMLEAEEEWYQRARRQASVEVLLEVE